MLLILQPSEQRSTLMGLCFCLRSAMLGGADAAPALMMRRNTGTDDSFTKRHYGGHMISAKLRDDPCEPLTDEASCSASPACVWCKAQAIPSSCFRKVWQTSPAHAQLASPPALRVPLHAILLALLPQHCPAFSFPFCQRLTPIRRRTPRSFRRASSFAPEFLSACVAKLDRITVVALPADGAPM